MDVLSEADHVVFDFKHARVVDISALLALDNLCWRLLEKGKRLHLRNCGSKLEHQIHNFKTSLPHLNEALKFDLLNSKGLYREGRGEDGEGS
jgi:MFS superfamily sulfate permease-like transporter